MKQSKLFENNIEFDPYEYMMISPNEKTELIIKHFMSIQKGEETNYTFIQNLIEMGANLEYLDKKFGESILHYACVYDDIKLVNMLFEHSKYFRFVNLDKSGNIDKF